MRIVSKKRLVALYKENKDAEIALRDWYSKTEEADWGTFNDVKKTFNTADFVGNKRVVFNIRGNKYRLITLILFKIKMVYIRFIGTHNDYDKISDIKNI